MTVILGPAANDTVNYGSKTGSYSIPNLMKPLHARDPGKWVAGHLLNDNLGGSGHASKNLTPLTQTANKQHSGLELRVKRAVIEARQYHDRNPKASFWKGVLYKVIVSDESFGDFNPYSGAPSHITVIAYRVNVSKNFVNHILTKKPMLRKEIHNRDAHL